VCSNQPTQVGFALSLLLSERSSPSTARELLDKQKG
jgi:hypothetical protein